jgi:16S rRNA (adenine1518-N6/adenine1519-N6)-dimethyltransferase
MAAKADSLRPRKRFGQHFLAHPGAVRRIVEALGPVEGPPLLEIGPGRGALTGPLLDAFGTLTAIEIDRDLAAALRARFPAGRLSLLEGDVLDVPLAEISGRPLRVVGNLPYNISKPVAAKLVRERSAVAGAVLMFQREVASRLTALPGCRAYGPLTILVGEAFRVERLFDLSPAAFRPPPEVHSTVTRWSPRAEAFTSVSESALAAVLRAGFAQRRRTLLNNLQRPLGKDLAQALLEEAGVAGTVRAETVSPEGWRRLGALWQERA